MFVYDKGWTIERGNEDTKFFIANDSKTIYAVSGVIDENSEINRVAKFVIEHPFIKGVTLENGITVIAPDENDNTKPAIIPDYE